MRDLRRHVRDWPTKVGERVARVLEGGIIVALLAGLLLVLASCGASTIEEGRALEESGDIGGAISLYEASLEKHPDDADVLEALGADLMMAGRYGEAVPYQEKTVQLDKNDVQTRIELGFNYLNHQNRPDDAARVLGEAAELEPTAKNLTFLAQAKEAMKDDSGAEVTLRRAIETDPKYVYSYKVLRALLERENRAADVKALEEMARSQGIDPSTL